MGNQHSPPPQLSEQEERSVLDFNVSVNAIVEKIKQLEIANKPGVVVLAGAGISVSAGIPDFRTPGTGLYHNLQKYNLPDPQSMFEISYFKENPEPFFTLAKEMYPGNFKPTPTHYFLKLLEEKGVLHRCYTQNIDTLEREAGISPELLVESHGSFANAHCVECHTEYSQEWMREAVFSDRIPRCTCGGLIKPDIVFFGENLPERFRTLHQSDMQSAEVLIVMGTSLSVRPFCLLPNDASPFCPRLLLNMDKVGERDFSGHGFRFDIHDNYRDTALLGPCDDGVRLLAEALGWTSELEALIGSPFTTPLPSDAQSALQKNWRRPLPPLPDIQPFKEALSPSSTEFECVLGEPGSFDDVMGGRPAFFSVNVPEEFQDIEMDYLCLIPEGSTMPAERTDRCFPFRISDDEEQWSPARLRLRIPWIRLELPYNMEVWYVDGRENAVRARWGPISIQQNAPEDVHEEEQPCADLSMLSPDELNQLVAKLAAEFGMPEEFARAMVDQQLSKEGGAGPQIEEIVDEDDGQTTGG